MSDLSDTYGNKSEVSSTNTFSQPSGITISVGLVYAAQLATGKAVSKASKERNIYGIVAAPYLAAKRTLDLYEGYCNLDEITADYENVVKNRTERLEAERKEQERLDAERRFDKESKKASRKIKK